MLRDCLSDASRSMRQIVVFFKAVDARQLSDPGDQLKKVLKFKKELESSKKHFYMNFDNATSFRRFLLKYLAQWVRDHEDGDPSADPPITPVPIIPSSEPPSPNEMLNQAERLAEDGDVIEAEEIFANEVSGGDLEALSRYASFLLRVGRLNQAEGMYRRIVESGLIDQEKRALDAYTNLGIILHARRDFDRAKEMYTKALEISEELDQTAQPTLYSNLALIEERRGHLERAAAFHRKALDVTEALGWASSGGFQFYSCFVSYSHEDESFARRLHDQLQGQGIRCWLDEHDLKPGDRILDVVNSAIRLHEKILLCCSKASLNSWWVREEIRKAQERERREARDIIIPVMIDRYLLDGWEDGLAADLRSRLAADFTGWEHDDAKFEEQFERVVKALRADQGVRENVLEPRS